MLRLDQARFVQGDFGLTADLSVPQAQVTAVIGPSGAGKSTFLHGMAGFVPLVAGRVLWQERDISQTEPGERPISMLFQDNNLFPHLTTMQNVALALEPRLRPRAEVRDRVKDMLLRVGLDGLSGRKPAGLSGGQQSRVALARALLQDRPVLLMDEPFGALGPALKAEMLDLSVELADGRTVVMITHDPADAARVADQVIGVAPGQALPPQPSGSFLSNPPAPLRSYFEQP